MALRGNLKDFSLPDVFQLVTFSKKTGVLRIHRSDGPEGSVWFRDGDVFFAQSNWHGEPLGERLVHAGKITPSALARALDIRENEGESGRRLGQVLVDEGYITDKILEAFVQEQIQDTIFDLMRWDEGDFDFELLPEVVHEDIGLSVSIENVIMEGSRRLEEWARIKKKIPSMDVVFKMATAPGEGTFEISLKPIEWNLLLVVDGTRSVAELAHERKRTDFEVARIMYGLYSAGLLEIAGDEEVERLRAERARREAARGVVAVAAAAAPQATVTKEPRVAAEQPAPEPAVEAAVEEPALPIVVPETPPGEPAVERAEPEMPEFLTAGGGGEATAEDMAVFEQMMGAVLEAPSAPSPAPAPAEPVPAPAPEPEAAPVVEPTLEATPPIESEEVLDLEAMAGVPAAPVAEVEAETEPSGIGAAAEVPGEEAALEGLILEEIETPSSEATPSTLEPVAGQEWETEIREPQGVLEAEPAPEIEEEPGEPEAVAKTGDLERDLMALGLGELPVEEAVSEPVPPEELTIAQIEAQAVAQTAEGVAEPELPEPAAASEPPDLSDILGALEDEELEIVQTESLDEQEVVDLSSAGVISTDAYLADISGDALDVGLSSGLGDELSALTGVASRARPQASVNKLPEPGSPVELHRDRSVDKELVLKIIDGIKKL